MINIRINIEKAKEIAHTERRIRREIEMEPHDNLIMKQIPTVSFDEVDAKRQVIRDKYAKLQDRIDACTEASEISQIIKEMRGQ